MGAGSNVLVGLALSTTCGAALLIIRHFLPLRSTPAYLVFPVFLALALPFSIIVLLPVDISFQCASWVQVPEVCSPSEILVISWRIIYWLAFALTW